MSGASSERILAGRPAADFIGRTEQADRLFAHARSGTGGGMLLLATPGSGASELLKQTYDRLFRDQQQIVPIYFAIRPAFRNGGEVAESFLGEYIRQLISFRRQDPTIIRAATGLDELAELSLSVGGFWIDRLIDMARNASASSDERSLVRTCLGAPVRAAANSERSFILIDDADELSNMSGGMSFFEELKEMFEGSDISFVVSGHRRFLHGQIDCDRMELDNLDFTDAGKLVEVLAKESNVTVSEPPRDLVATQFAGNAKLIHQHIRTAHDSPTSLESFESVEKVYADALFGGRIGRQFDKVFASACQSVEIEQRVVSMLFDGQVSETGRVERDRWHRRLQLGSDATEALLARLNIAELIRLTPSHVEAMSENVVLTDYVASRFRMTSTPEGRATIFSDSLTSYIKRAPDMMAHTYRVNHSIGIREVLGSFAGQKLASILLDYGEFRDGLKGASTDEVSQKVSIAPSIMLPRIFFTTAASDFYKPLAQIAESERSAIALGFEGRDTGDEDVVWIAAEIDSKLEASREITEFWCDRLEAAAVMCDFARFKLWLIAPEGFTPDALELLGERNAYGSSRRQVTLLRLFLDAPAAEPHELAANEYEIVIPMSEDAELIAAHAVEEIARRHNFDPKSINQIKTALVEACINASEYSLSPDGKIYQRFRIEDDRVVLTISNRGLRLASKLGAAEPDEGRRGWGLKLMRRLMDEVTVEHVDDGTRIVMTKYMRAA